MADTSVAIIVSASITASVALGGIVATVLVGARGQRKTLEHTAEQARLAREADAKREALATAQRRYERVRGIVEPYVSLAREMRETTSAWQIVLAPTTLEEKINMMRTRIDAVWEGAEQRRGDFEIEPGLDELREIFKRMASAYGVYSGLLGTRTIPGWVTMASQKTQEIHDEADRFIAAARNLVARLEAESALD